MAENDRVLSEWLGAQVGCIGCVLKAPDLAGRLLSETSADDFDGPGKVVYQAISTLFNDGKTPDAVQVAEQTQGMYNEYMLQCMDVTPSTAVFGQYIESVKAKAQLARLRSILTVAAGSASLDEISECLSKANELLVTSRSSRVYSIQELIEDFYERKQNRETYLSTGLRHLDSVLYLSRGDYVILAGRPSRGKTSLAIQMALEQSKQYRVGFFSAETGKEKVTDRMIAHWAGVDMQHIKMADLSDDEWNDIGQAVSFMSEHHKIDVIKAAGMSVDDIFHIAIGRRYEIIYIDYLQIVNGSGKSRYEIVTNISARIHQLSQQHGIMVVALSQLSRENNKSKTEEPDMFDLRESGQIEQDADAILMIYCQQKDHLSGPRDLKIAKNKEGELFKLSLAWDGKTQTFTPLSRRTPPPLPKTAFKPLPENTPVPDEFEQTTIDDTQNKSAAP